MTIIPYSIQEASLLPSGVAAPARTTPRHVRKDQRHISIRKLSIIIPCYNEASTIAIILDKVMDVVLSHGIEKEVLLINDCSKDDTGLMISEYLAENPEAPIKYIGRALRFKRAWRQPRAITF